MENSNLDFRIEQLIRQNEVWKANLQRLRHSVRKAAFQQWKCKWTQKYLKTATALRGIVDHSIAWRPGAALITGSLLLILPLLIIGSPFVSVTTGAAGVILCALILYLPADASIPSLHADIVGQLDQARGVLTQQPLEIEAIRKWMAIADAEFRQLRKQQWQQSEEFQAQQRLLAKQAFLQTLLSRDWKSLRSEPFEKYLEEVFSALGYSVQTTAVTGDQGVDLIVAKHSMKIAIQVKGYFHSVSNGAVQEAYAGMTFYGCAASAVITNSVFTNSAKELAQRLRCALIDETALPLLVLGKIDLYDLCCRITARNEPKFGIPPAK